MSDELDRWLRDAICAHREQGICPDCRAFLTAWSRRHHGPSLVPDDAAPGPDPEPEDDPHA